MEARRLSGERIRRRYHAKQ